MRQTGERERTGADRRRKCKTKYHNILCNLTTCTHHNICIKCGVGLGLSGGIWWPLFGACEQLWCSAFGICCLWTKPVERNAKQKFNQKDRPLLHNLTSSSFSQSLHSCQCLNVAAQSSNHTIIQHLAQCTFIFYCLVFNNMFLSCFISANSQQNTMFKLKGKR